MNDAYLREIFESGKSDDNASFTVDDRYCEIGCLNKLQNFRVRVDAVVNVVLPDFYKIDDSISIEFEFSEDISEEEQEWRSYCI